jgi:putative AdoMet-dependent methyltransferase
LEDHRAAAGEPDAQARGKFYLFDIVFPGAAADLRTPIERWMHLMQEKVGPEFAAEVETHIRDEFSTYDWILEGMPTRAGFRIDTVQYGGGFGATYMCTKAG